MTKEDMLRAYLEDPYFVENGLLKEGESKNAKWIDHQDSKLIDVIKQAIDGVSKREKENKDVVLRRINKTLDR